MHSIKEILDINKNYDIESKRLQELKKSVQEANDNINFEEVKANLTYAEAKELYQIVSYRISPEKSDIFKRILQGKKALEYPQINDVHYYPAINNIDFLSKEEKISLDTLLKKIYNYESKRRSISNLDEQTIDFLIKNSIVEKLYIFHCSCGSIECSDKIITQEKFDKLKDYWKKELDGENTDEEDEEMNYGCFMTGCWNDGEVEVYSLETFNENLKRIEYKVKMAPDMTLDNI